MDALRLGVMASALWALAVSAGMLLRAHAYGKRSFKAAALGNPVKGILYAFTLGMLPGAKESVRLHLPTFFTGLVYHAGLAAALAYLVVLLTRMSVPPGLLLTFRVLPALGAAAGLGLLAKRALTPVLRGLSCPDDYASNALATAFAASVALHAFGLVSEVIPFVAALVLFLYLPFGKIRHCVFFFTTRWHFGVFFGRRGAMPPPAGAPRG